MAGDANDPTYRDPSQPVERRVEDLLARMTLAEKVEQLHGLQRAPIDDLYHTPPNERLGIPTVAFMVTMVFASAMGLATPPCGSCLWVGAAIGDIQAAPVGQGTPNQTVVRCGPDKVANTTALAARTFARSRVACSSTLPTMSTPGASC